MPPPPRRPTTRARPLPHDAAYAERGRRQAERKAQEHQRARAEREARGEVRIQPCVPAVHEDLIRDLVAALCAALNEGRSPEQILSWQPAPTANTASVRPSKPAATLPARGNRAHRRRSRQEEGVDDPAARRGQGLLVRRRAQSQRWAARKKAAGFMRISLVVPRVLRATILDILAQIRARLTEGLLPTIGGTAAGSAETTELPAAETSAEASVATLSCAPTFPGTGEQGAQGATGGETPSRPTDGDPATQVPSLGCPRGLPSHDAVLSGSEPRRLEAFLLADRAEKRSPLFDDIHMLDWLAGSRSSVSGSGG